MDERFVRVSAYAGKNCCPLKIRGLDPKSDEEEAMAAIERMFQSTWKVEIVDSIKSDDVLIITDAVIKEVKNGRD